MKNERRPPGITALAMFFAFCAIVTGVMATLILFPGSLGDAPATAASPLMITIGLLLMLASCIACIAAAIGLWRLTLWGMWTSIVILCGTVLSELSDLITAQQGRSLIGILVSGLLIWYLWRKKPVFEQSGQAAAPQNQSQSAQTSA
jgi:hypothetical protein